MKQELLKKFEEVFGDSKGAGVYFAPGRVNLIGEHTDYNGGHVFPCALTIGTYAVARLRDDDKLCLFSMNFEDDGVGESRLADIETKKDGDWRNYPKGIVWAFGKKGYKVDKGLDILYFGNIPNGSGLSSSASIEVLTGFILKELFGFDVTNQDLAIAMGKKDCAIFLDTADLSYEYAPIVLKGAKIVILNTNKKRGLGDSKYNERRSECEVALAALQTKLSIKSLGELTEEEFEANKELIGDPVKIKRAKHAVYENQRTIKAVKALKDNDLELFGKLMIASHDSLRDDYEVTGIELDTLVAEALKQQGVIGARMTGAGFGGCAVSIVKEEAVPAFIENVGKAYKEKIGYAADFYVVEIGDGPSVL